MKKPSAKDLETILSYVFAIVEQGKVNHIDMSPEWYDAATYYVMSKSSTLGFDTTRTLVEAADRHLDEKRWQSSNYPEVFADFLSHSMKRKNNDI
jgi:hypothetical protein